MRFFNSRPKATVIEAPAMVSSHSTTSTNEKSREDDSSDTIQESELNRVQTSAATYDTHAASQPLEKNAAEKRVEGLSAGNEGEDDDSRYPKGGRLALIMVAICLAVLCVALDNTIISTAIPRITDQFKALDDIGWYGSAYLAATCAFQLFFGKLYTYFPIKWVYLVAIILFEIGSVVCGAAPNSIALIVGRAIAGVGTAGIFSGAILVIGNTVPLSKRPAYTGLVGGMYGIASVVAPLIGGAFTDNVTWRWCFYINLPIGAVTILFLCIFYKADASAQKLPPGWKDRIAQLDIVGTIIFIPTIICLLVALQWGGSKYPWSDGKVIALLVVFGVLLIVFIALQILKQDHATVPPRILRQRTVASTAWFALSLGGAFFIFVYYLPLWFQAIKGTSAVHSGIDNIPMVLGLVVFSLLAGAIVTSIGLYAPFLIASTVLMAVGAGLLTTLQPDTGHSKWIGYQVIFGAGLGFGWQQTWIAVQAVLPEQDHPVGTSIVTFGQLIGGAVFVSVAQNIFANKLLSSIQAVDPSINAQLVLSAGATSLADTIPPQYLDQVKSAYNGALVDAFYVATAMAAVSVFGLIFLEWKNIKGQKVQMTAA